MIAFLKIGEGWLEFPWTLMANEIIWRQMRIIMPVFISTPLLNLPKQKLFFYRFFYFSGPRQMLKRNPGKVILIISDYKTYYIWAAFTSLIRSTFPLTEPTASEPSSTEGSENHSQYAGVECMMLVTQQGNSRSFIFLSKDDIESYREKSVRSWLDI